MDPNEENFCDQTKSVPQSGIFKTLLEDGKLLVSLVNTGEVIKEAAMRHKFTPVAAAALGRVFPAAAYLCSFLKDEQSALHVELSGGGAGGKISVSGNGALHLSGYAEHGDISLPLRENREDLVGFVGANGYLNVVRVEDHLPFVGTSRLKTGEIEGDFEEYFASSEQRNVCLSLYSSLSGEGDRYLSGGIFLEALPGAEEETISRSVRLKDELSKELENALKGDAKQFLKTFFHAEKIYEREISFRCHCSEEKAKCAVLAMGKKEAETLLAETGGIFVHCPDCNTDYIFDEKDIAELFG